MEKYIEKIISNPSNFIAVWGGQGVGFSGFVDAELVFGASAQYGSLADSSSLDSISQNLQLATETLNIDGIGTQTLKYPMLSKKSWQGSSVNDLSFSIYKVAINPTDDIYGEVSSFWKAILPGTNGIGEAFTPPNDYKIAKGDKTENHLVIQIGDWFEADGLICTSAMVTISKEKIDGVKPLYIRLDVTFTPTMSFSESEIAGWFKM